VVPHTRHPVGDGVPLSRCTSAFWQVRHGAGDPAAACRFTRPSPRDVDRLSSGVRREGVIPRLVVRGPIAVALPRSHSPRTLPSTVLSTQLPAYVDRSQVGWGPVIGRERRRVPPMIAPPPSRPAGDPTPITQVKVRTLAKSITGFSLSKLVPGFKTGYRFSGSRLTSLTGISSVTLRSVIEYGLSLRCLLIKSVNVIFLTIG